MIDTCTSHLVENIGSAPGGTFEPVATVIPPDISRQFSEPAAFVVRWARKSDYMIMVDVEINFYLDKGQLTGRTLDLAVGAGKAAVSIPYWAAKELLENRRGLLVAFGDSQALSVATAEFIDEESQMAEIQSRAYACGMNTTQHPQVGYQWHRMPGDRNSA